MATKRVVSFEEVSPAPTQRRAISFEAADDAQEASPRRAEALISGAAKAATLGYQPELSAAAGKMLQDPNKGVNESLRAQGFEIQEPEFSGPTLDEARQRQIDLKNEAPGHFLAGEVTGGILSAPAAGGLLGRAGVVAKEAKTIGQGAYQGLKAGGALGLLQNPNERPGEEGLNVGERLVGGAAGAALGGAAGAAGGAISSLSRENVAKRAQESALASFRPSKRQVTLNRDRLDKLGQTALDEGIITKQPRSYDELAESASEALNKKGKEIDDWIEKISDAASQKAPGQPTGVNKDKLLASVSEDFKSLAETEGNKGDIQKIRSMVDEFYKNKPETIPIKDAQSFKKKYGDMINWKRLPDSDVPLKEKFYRSIYDKLKVGIEDTAESLADTLGPSAKNEYQATKDSYRNLKSLFQMANESADRQLANRYVSLSDYQSGQLGGVVGAMTASDPASMVARGLLGKAVGMAGNKAARLFGQQQLAARRYGLLKAMDKAPGVTRKLGLLGRSLQESPGALPGAAALAGGGLDE